MHNIYRRRYASTSKHALIDTWVNGYVTWTCEVHRFTDRQRHYILHIWHSDNYTVKVVHQKMIAVLDLKTEISFCELRYWIVAEIYGDLAIGRLPSWMAPSSPSNRPCCVWSVNLCEERTAISDFWTCRHLRMCTFYWPGCMHSVCSMRPHLQKCVCVCTQQHNFWVKSRDVSWRISANREVAQTLQDFPGQWIIYYSV